MTTVAPKKNTKKKDSFRFDQALGELEVIVQSLESGELGLEEALGRFEEGVKLTRHCQKALDEARQRVETLVEENTQTQPSDQEDADEF